MIFTATQRKPLGADMALFPKWRTISCMVLVCLGAFISLTNIGKEFVGYLQSQWNWRSSAVSESIGRGEQIIMEIEAYSQIHGQPPASLETLVPHFLKKIPVPIAGSGKWHYSRHPDNSFTLQFETRYGYPKCYYRSSQREWFEDN